MILLFFSAWAPIHEMWNTSSTLHSKIRGEKQWENQMEGKFYSEFLLFNRNRESRSGNHVEK